MKDAYYELEQQFLEVKSALKFNLTKNYVGVLDDKNVVAEFDFKR